MHEMHLLRHLKEDLIHSAEANGIKKIKKIYLKMGKFTEINPEILRFFFENEATEDLFKGIEIFIEEGGLNELTLLSYDGV